MRLWPMLWKELVQLRRDRFTLAMMLGIPAIQLVLFGYAIQTEVRHLATVVLDESRTPESRRLIEVLRNTGNFDIVEQVRSRTELADRIETGRASAGLVIPPRFMRDIERGATGQAQIIVDAADPLASSAALSGAALAGSARAAELSGGRRPRLEVRVRPWYNPGLRSAVYIVPGIIGVLLSLTLVLITSMSIVRERERGTLEQLIVTPISKTAVILGKILPFLGIGFVQVTVVLIAARVIFRVPSEGSLLLLYVFALLFMLGMLALGIFMSTLARTQTQALQLSLLVMLPSILLSGFMFPLAAMPRVARIAGSLLPVPHFLTALRGILLKGSGIAALWPQALILTAVALVLITLSIRRFAKTLE